MTPQEAINTLVNGTISAQEKLRARDKAISALEKQIEKKPIIKQRVGLEYYTCPNPECEDYLGYRFPKRLVKTSYCECCGRL